MAELGFTGFVLVADTQAAGLCVAQVGAGADLEEFALPGGPGFNVAGFDFQVRQVAGAAFQLPDGISRERNSSTE